jgi:glycosyltransferase involved in cell wall biosynthesis
MTSRPLVSVRVVTYNQESMVEDTLDSIVSQDYEPLEVVVADDASSDSTPQILASYQKRYRGRVKAILADERLGVTRNGNRALRQCSGELIAHVDGDDLCLPGKIAAQAKWFGDDPRRVLCGHDVEHFSSSSGGLLGRHSETVRPSEGAGPRAFIVNGPPFVASSVMFRRKAIPATGYDERLPLLSDWKLWIDCLMSDGLFGYLPQVLGRYRHHDKTMTNSAARQCWLEALMTLTIVEVDHPELTTLCRKGRARLYQQQGIESLIAHDIGAARQLLASSFATAPTRSWKVPMWLALARLPGDLGLNLANRAFAVARKAPLRAFSQPGEPPRAIADGGGENASTEARPSAGRNVGPS